jgi:hypothetical protein
MLIQGDVIPLSTGVTFPSGDLKPTTAKRVLHDGSNYLVADLSSSLNPSFYYYQTNGVQTAAYIAANDYIFDVAFNNNKYYTARAATSGSNIIGVIVEQVTAAGVVVTNVLNYLNVISGLTSNFSSILPRVELVVTDYAKVYLRVDQGIYDLPASGSLFPSVSGYTESDLNINLLTSGINQSAGSLIYSRKDSHFIGLFEYKPSVDEVILETWAVTSGNSPTYKDRQLFLAPASTSNRSSMSGTSDSSFFYNELDHNTLYLVTTDTGINRSVLSSYNVDSLSTGFAAVNLEDVSLRAGTGASSNVYASAINVWGEPLNNKQVNFLITQGDGVLNPLVVNTNISGIATSLYTAGTVAGPVQIQIEVSD